MIHFCGDRTFFSDDLFLDAENAGFHLTVEKEKEPEWAPEEGPDKDALNIISGRD